MSKVIVRESKESDVLSPLYLGLDVHKKDWQMSIYSVSGESENRRHRGDVASICSYLGEHYPKDRYVCVYEAGRQGFSIQREFAARGIDCMVVNPADVPQTDRDKKRKTDQADARRLARALRSGDLSPIHVPSEAEVSCRSLVRLRRQMVGDRARTRNRIKSHLAFMGVDLPKAYDGRNWTQAFLTWLTEASLSHPSARTTLDLLVSEHQRQHKSVLEVEAELRKLAKSERYIQPMEWLQSVPGIGLITALVLFSEIGNINRFPSLDHLRSYVGLTPKEHSSGERVRRSGINKRGNAYLRFMLIEAAWRAIRQDRTLGRDFEILCKRMVPQKAIVRIAVRLLNRIRFVLKNKQCLKDP